MTLIDRLEKCVCTPIVAILHESEVLLHVRYFRNRWKAVQGC